MARRGYQRTRYSTPKKGTKQRRVLLALLRPEGVSSEQLKRIGPSAHANLVMLRDVGGWDIRMFKLRKPEAYLAQGEHRLLNVYRIVGRLRFNGGYRSFVDPNSALDEISDLRS